MSPAPPQPGSSVSTLRLRIGADLKAGAGPLAARAARLSGPLAVVALVACMAPGGRGGGEFGGPGRAVPELREPQAIRVPAVPQLAGYSSALKVGFTVYVAGQVGFDAPGHPAGETLREQTTQAVTNLISIVQAARGVAGDVVKLTFFYTQTSPDDIAEITGVVDTLLSRTHPPALTLVPVSSLPLPDLKVAVDGIAVLRGEFPDRTRHRE